jgi:8-oxo-dGTP diphosphatase
MGKSVTPLLTVDAVVFDAKGRLLVIRRKNPPFQGEYALPGGFVDVGEDVETACRRELQEETGLAVGKLTLVGVYSDPGRDPRGHTCSVAFLGRAGGSRAVAGDDAAAVEWLADWKKANFALDHREIVADAVKILQRARRAKS